MNSAVRPYTTGMMVVDSGLSHTGRLDIHSLSHHPWRLDLAAGAAGRAWYNFNQLLSCRQRYYIPATVEVPPTCCGYLLKSIRILKNRRDSFKIQPEPEMSQFMSNYGVSLRGKVIFAKTDEPRHV
jgi:hypothetical protein